MNNNVAKIRVLGIGGGGSNAVGYMSNSDFQSVEFAIFNTDVQALNNFVNIENKFTLGQNITKGLGAGANPDVGAKATEENIETIANFIDGSNMVFITAGMGGGTGTGGAPVVAKCSKDKDILTIAVVTKPFPFEGRKRLNVAEKGLDELKNNVDSLIVIPNEKLISSLGENAKLIDAFNEANDVLLKAVKGVSDLITKPGLINIDFADIRTVMKNSGYSMMGIGIASGEEKAKMAVEKALTSPLLDNLDIKGAKGLLVNISSGENLSMGDFNIIGNIIDSYADIDSITVIGTTIDEQLNDSIQVTVVATGLNEKEKINIEIQDKESPFNNIEKNNEESTISTDIFSNKNNNLSISNQSNSGINIIDIENNKKDETSPIKSSRISKILNSLVNKP